MKKKILLLSSLLMFLTIAFIACKKDLSTNDTKQVENTNFTKSLARYSAGYTPIDFDAVDIGEIHNQLLENAFENLLPTNEQNLDVLTEYFQNTNYDYEGMGMTQTEWQNLLFSINENMKGIDFDMSNYTGSEITPLTKSYIVQIIDLCENISDLAIFNDSVDAIVASASNQLFDLDFDIVKASGIIAKSSAKLWAPTSIGGDGLYDRFIANNSGGAQFRQLSRWERVLIGDVSGASQYFLGLGIAASVTAAAIPGTNALLALGLGISVGLSSGYAALF